MNIQDLIPFNTSITESEVVAFEKELGFKLPQDYRSFLLTHNGGSLEDYIFHVEYLEQDFMVHVFNGLNTEHRALDLRYWFETYDDEIPKKSLLIGRDPGGIHLLYITKGEDKGIYIWDHAHTLKESSEDSNAFFVAESFEEFINSLKKFEDPA